jgi:Ni/Co efflux regulator RcnB
MKKLLAILIAAAVAGASISAIAADKKPAATQVKKVKKHKKAESTGKVANDKPKKIAPAKKK